MGNKFCSNYSNKIKKERKSRLHGIETPTFFDARDGHSKIGAFALPKQISGVTVKGLKELQCRFAYLYILEIIQEIRI